MTISPADTSVLFFHSLFFASLFFASLFFASLFFASLFFVFLFFDFYFSLFVYFFSYFSKHIKYTPLSKPPLLHPPPPSFQQSNWSTPNPSIGRIANYSSLLAQRPRDYNVYDAQFGGWLWLVVVVLAVGGCVWLLLLWLL